MKIIIARLFAFFICPILGFSVLVQAQTPAPTPVPTARVVVSDSMLNLELEMAESSYSLNPNLESKSRLLNIYEKVVYSRCMAEMRRTLVFAGATHDQVCIDYIAKIFTLDPGNIVAYCARDGIDSESCRYASNRQSIIVFDPKKEEESGAASLDEVIARRKEGTKVREETLKLLSRVRTLQRAKAQAGTLMQIRTSVERILSLNCSGPADIRVKLTGEEKKEEVVAEPTVSSLVPPDDAATSGDSANKSGDDPISKLLRENFHTPTPAVRLEKSFRQYEISKTCNDYILEALKIDPNLSTAHCYKYGFYSWQCMNALRHERRTGPSQSGKPGTPQPGAGIVKF